MVSDRAGKGIDRRQFLRRAAMAGAGAAWTTPVVRTITGTPAFAKGVTGSPKDDPGGTSGGFSSIAVSYSSSGGTAARQEGKPTGPSRSAQTGPTRPTGDPTTTSGQGVVE